jgi:hypothetical protein
VPSELRAAIIQPRLAAQHEIPLDDVRLPRTTLTDVPSLSARAAATASIQRIFPVPNGTEILDPRRDPTGSPISNQFPRFSPAFGDHLSRLVHQKAAQKPISGARTATYVIFSTGSGPGGRRFKSFRPDHFF